MLKHVKSIQLFVWWWELAFKKKRLIIVIEFLILALIKLNIKGDPFFWVSRERWTFLRVGGAGGWYILEVYFEWVRVVIFMGGWGWVGFGGYFMGRWGWVEVGWGIFWVGGSEWTFFMSEWGWESYILSRWTFLLVGMGGWRGVEIYFCWVDGHFLWVDRGKFRMVEHFL